MGCVILLPVVVYFLYHDYHINSQELQLLLSAFLMLAVLPFNNWLTYLTYLIVCGWQALLLFNMGRNTLFFDRYKSTHAFSPATECFFTHQDQETVPLLYAVVFWLGIRILTSKSIHYDMGEGLTFRETMHGWNCTAAELWVVPSLWLLVLVGACFACRFLIEHETDHNNLYKEYLLDFKIYYDLAITCLVVYYNLSAFIGSGTLSACQSHYNSGLFFRLVWMWGYPLSTIIFFYKKEGVFSMKATSEKAEQENELEEQLQHQEIDREHSHISNRSQKPFH